MNKPNLDQVIERRGTGCTKFDAISAVIGDRPDVLPMWIADMDFATPDFVIQAVQERLQHPVLGYSFPPDAYYTALQGWFERRYGFRPEREELCYTPGIVAGIYKIVQCFTAEGEGVAICPPVYHPFAQVIKGSRRQVVEAPLLLTDRGFEIDYTALEQALERAKVLLWCHPHNPGGRVWSLDELRRVAEIAYRHGAIVVSDEIHADLTLYGQRHTPFPQVSPEARNCSISLMAPSKAFNMPGIIASQIYVVEPQLRKTLFDYLELNCLNHANATTYGAVTAAYNQGDEWLEHVLRYIEGNIAHTRQFLLERVPKIGMITPEASFLIFLDCRQLGMDDKTLSDFFLNQAHLLLNNGGMFGTGGEGFMRLNVGVPRAVLQDALERIERAVYAKN